MEHRGTSGAGVGWRARGPNAGAGAECERVCRTVRPVDQGAVPGPGGAAGGALRPTPAAGIRGALPSRANPPGAGQAHPAVAPAEAARPAGAAEATTRGPAQLLLPGGPAGEGFFEHPEYLAVRAHLPAPWQDILDLAYYSGWRKKRDPRPHLGGNRRGRRRHPALARALEDLGGADSPDLTTDCLPPAGLSPAIHIRVFPDIHQPTVARPSATTGPARGSRHAATRRAVPARA